ncbi:MAG TPA: DNA-processing protein DprA [Candidatus Limnocylindrales bacterium]|nr:DNA-processing protein DprA [Candidatus Limnocylindrales bacterium]
MGTGAPAAGVRAVTREDREALAVLLAVEGLGPMTLGRLVDAAGSPVGVLELARHSKAIDLLVDASRPSGDGERAMPADVAVRIVESLRSGDRTLREIERLHLSLVVPDDREYPRRLLAIEVPPPGLFVRGSLEALAADHVVGVVGTRHPSPSGRRIASRIGAALVRAGATVVSGLAVGIDGAAHAAVVAEGGRTVAFIGGGHARLYPTAHDRLADAIVEKGGAVVSEYAPFTEPSRGTFPQRNRLISGASDAVVVVEAGARSGALVTASWALEQGRECFVVPGPIDAPTAAGCNGFLRDWHDLAKIVSGIPQLLDDLGLAAEAGLPVLQAPDPTPQSGTAIVSSRVKLPSASSVLRNSEPAERSVAEAIVHGAVTADELVAVTRLSIGAVLGALTRLESRGLVRAIHGRYEPVGPLAGVDPMAA